jgi:hypothetical protein
MKISRKLKLFTLLLAVTIPVGVWVFFKPVRILAPELNGVTCYDAVCVEEPSQLQKAQKLQQEAIDQVAIKLAPLNEAPLTVFCSTRSCYHSFGGGMERGATLFNLGVILPQESWVPHIIEHEYIHMLQSQELGLLGREKTPDWFKEGRPFLISEPPANDLPDYAKPLVAEYQAWELRVGRKNVWQAIENPKTRLTTQSR